MLFIKDPDRFNKIAGGIQNIVLSIAIIIGGGWTLYVFDAEYRVDNAKFQLEKIKREITEQINVEIKLDIDYIKTETSNDRYLIGLVHFFNHGSVYSVLNILEASLKLTKVEIDKDDNILFGKTIKSKLYCDPGHDVAGTSAIPGVDNSDSFVFKVETPGLYLISVIIPKSPTESAIVEKYNTTPATKNSWGTSKFIYIP